MKVFKLQETPNATSQCKYISSFEQMLKFFITDIDSPEATEGEDVQVLLTKDYKIKTIQHEIETSTSSLWKKKGEDMIKTKERAKQRQVGESDIDGIIGGNEEFLCSVIADHEEGKLAEYEIKKVFKVRDTLMASGTVRLGWRALEIVKMTKDEVNAAEKMLIEEEF